MKILRVTCLFMIIYGLGYHTSFSQSANNPIEIQLQMIFINMERYDSIHQDSIPVNISFNFHVINHTDKRALFGYGLRYGDDNERHPYGGRMFLIDGKGEPIELHGGLGKTLMGVIPNDTVEFWGALEIDDAYFIKPPSGKFFQVFLNRYAKRDVEFKQFLYDYFKNCTLVYLPIPKDYEELLQSLDPSKYYTKDRLYPTHPIVVSYYNPWGIFISQIEYSGGLIRQWVYQDGAAIFPDSIETFHTNRLIER